MFACLCARSSCVPHIQPTHPGTDLRIQLRDVQLDVGASLRQLSTHLRPVDRLDEVLAVHGLGGRVLEQSDAVGVDQRTIQPGDALSRARAGDLEAPEALQDALAAGPALGDRPSHRAGHGEHRRGRAGPVRGVEDGAGEPRRPYPLSACRRYCVSAARVRPG